MNRGHQDQAEITDALKSGHEDWVSAIMQSHILASLKQSSDS